jgi:tRNA (mo5U34)-methyltransferase
VVALEPMPPAVTGFDKVREAIGSTRTHLVRGTVYDLNPARLGHFDLVLFCGVLYHLRYPLLAIDNIRRVCRGDVLVETLAADAQLLAPGPEGVRCLALETVAPLLMDVPLWQFYRRDEMNRDPSNWFGPTTAAVLEAFESAGFEMKLLQKSGRAHFHGRVRPGLPEFLTLPCIEADYYDCVMRPLFEEDKASWAAEQLAPPLQPAPPPAQSGGPAS